MSEGDGGDDGEPDADEELTYADAGVDIDASEAATAALIGAVGADTEAEGSGSEYAGLLDIGDRYLALATDGVGTKLLVAEALGDYSTVGIDCIAMNVNDLVAAGASAGYSVYRGLPSVDPYRKLTRSFRWIRSRSACLRSAAREAKM